MKATTEKTCKEESNAWGAYSTVCRQRFEVETSDVGRNKPNYLGFNHSTYKIHVGDVSRTIEVLTDNDISDWTCWSFVS